MPHLRPVLLLTVSLVLALSLGCEKENAQKPATDSTPKETSSNTTSENEGHQGIDALAREDGPAPITPKKLGTPGEAKVDENALDNLAGAVATDKPFVAAKPHQRPEDGITFLSWSDTGQLVLGYGDGRLAMIDVAGKQGEVEVLSEDKAPVVAISPNTKLAVLDTSPPRLIKREGHADILTFSYLDHLA
ncbi:MAG: hypothetical protein VX475_05035, partial [Myxococcota bacterium]|nr:hypothetical protein [Myxococcota bacterium]